MKLTLKNTTEEFLHATEIIFKMFQTTNAPFFFFLEKYYWKIVLASIYYCFASAQ